MTELTLSSHVLNLDSGRPVPGLTVSLATAAGTELATATTDADGRIKHWATIATLAPGDYLVRFGIGEWFATQGQDCFYPEVVVHCRLTDEQPHYHVPLLLNRYGYSTYRGS